MSQSGKFEAKALGDDILKRERDFYDSLAATWWDRKGPFWPLHRLNALRMKWIMQNLDKLGFTDADDSQSLNGLKVLDIGCGGGILSESLARLGAEVHGIDVSEKSIKVARRHASAHDLSIHYENIEIDALIRRQEHYDLVFNMEVVEHVADVDKFMSQACQLVRPQGLMFVASISRTLSAAVIAIFGAEYVLRYLPRGTHRYSQLVKPQEVTTVLEEKGMSAVNWTGVGVNPFKRDMYLRRNMSVNYMLCAVK